MNKPEFNARRRFLQQSGALSAAGAAGGSWLLNLAAIGDAAAASNGGNYKALVCVFLYGGNDACNTVLPIDDASWARYDEVRSIPSGVTGPLADLRLSRTALRNISAKVSGQTVQYGLHPNLSNVQSLYNQGKLAVVANLGTMTKGPVRRSDLGTTATESNGGVPPKLRSHNDQQTIWQSGRSNQETRGWGGRVADPAAFAFATTDSADKANAFRSVYLGDSPTFVFGDKVPAYGLTTSNNGVVPLLPGAGGKLYNGVNVSMLTNLLKGTAGGTRSNLLEKDLIQLTARSLDAESYLTAKLSALPLDSPCLPTTTWPRNSRSWPGSSRRTRHVRVVRCSLSPLAASTPTTTSVRRVATMTCSSRWTRPWATSPTPWVLTSTRSRPSRPRTSVACSTATAMARTTPGAHTTSSWVARSMAVRCMGACRRMPGWATVTTTRR